MPFHSTPLLSAHFGHFSLFSAPPQPFPTLVLSLLPSPAVLWCYLLSHCSCSLTLWLLSCLFIAAVLGIQPQTWTTFCIPFSPMSLGCVLPDPTGTLDRYQHWQQCRHPSDTGYSIGHQNSMWLPSAGFAKLKPFHVGSILTTIVFNLTHLIC